MALDYPFSSTKGQVIDLSLFVAPAILDHDWENFKDENEARISTSGAKAPRGVTIRLIANKGEFRRLAFPVQEPAMA